MYYVDGLVCGGEPTDTIKITSVKTLADRIMLVTFNSGEERVFDSTVLNGIVYEPLNNKEIFDSVSIDHGVLTWLDGQIDCAPEYVYSHSYEYEHITA